MGERLNVGDICTRSVVIASRQTPLDDAACLMRDHHVGSLVVVDEIEGQRIVVGLLTDRDIVTAVVAKDLLPGGLCAGDVMTTDLLTACPEDSMVDLMRAMRRKGVRRVPVVGDRRQLVGIVSLDDLLETLTEEIGLLVATVQRSGQREREMRP